MTDEELERPARVNKDQSSMRKIGGVALLAAGELVTLLYVQARWIWHPPSNVIVAYEDSWGAAFSRHWGTSRGWGVVTIHVIILLVVSGVSLLRSGHRQRGPSPQ